MNPKFSSLLLIVSLLVSHMAISQDTPNDDLHITGFIDTYYSYDFSQPNTSIRQPFLFNHNRHNEFNINLALIRLDYEKQRYHARIALQAGTYAQDNYAAEENMLQRLNEAYVGLSLNRANTLWLDAGVFSSHLGFASALSIENFTLTRPLVAESSPYFLSGAKLSYSPNDRWFLMAVATNGWQRIQRVPGNSLISMGTQVQFLPNENVLLNWSTFIGTEDPDETRRMRYFNNLYATFSLSEKLDLITGFDFGWQQTAKNSDTYDMWYGPVVVAHMQWNQRWATGLRVEYFDDENEIVTSSSGPAGFKTTGVSLNMDYQPDNRIMCRIEGRYFHSPDDLFDDISSLSNQNFFMTASIAILFDKSW
ncbi:porin [Reichenbachiella ulvae]|uniref:Porin n=1 Tax=Reichenbachiella ulvae TaxID=2980104 RepID=A0ABT3CYB2_9BACT|nr:porin [Reichenbachiella ulvae]MCV9388637.1 porin [Reichenbachiella ulvae]